MLSPLYVSWVAQYIPLSTSVDWREAIHFLLIKWPNIVTFLSIKLLDFFHFPFVEWLSSMHVARKGTGCPVGGQFFRNLWKMHPQHTSLRGHSSTTSQILMKRVSCHFIEAFQGENGTSDTIQKGGDICKPERTTALSIFLMKML